MDCDESYILELETTVEELANRCAKLERIIVDQSNRKAGTFREMELAILDEWLARHGLKRVGSDG